MKVQITRDKEGAYAASPPSEIEGRVVVVALPPPEPSHEERLQAMAEARAAAKSAFADFSVEESIQERRGEEESDACYGAFPGGDPRAFEPDPEVCTPAELEAHQMACAEAAAMEARGEVPDWPPSHHWGQCSDAVVHVAAGGFGVGVYSVGDAEEREGGIQCL